MGSTVESIISILKLLFGLFVYFGLPALVFFVTFAVTVILVTRIGSSLLTVVVTRLPTVARPLNSLTRKFTNSSRDGDFERTRIGVVGGLAVVYAVIYILGAWGVFAVFDEIGEALFATPPEWYLPVTEYSYPIVALLVALPLILVLQAWR